MSTTAPHPLAADYLRRLRAAGGGLPPGRLDDLCAELASHLAEAIPPGASDTEARAAIDRLGPPEEIIDAERPAASPPAPGGHAPGADPRTWHEWAAIVLLPLGGFVFGFGWLAGVVLLWTSRAWSIRDKLIGTLIVPGGLATAAAVLLVSVGSEHQLCTSLATSGSGSGQFPGTTTHCQTIGSGPSTLHRVLGLILLAIAVLGPIVTAIYLARRAGRAPLPD